MPNLSELIIMTDCDNVRCLHVEKPPTPRTNQNHSLITAVDPQFEDIHLDVGSSEVVTFSQTDEFGRQHIVVLSALQVSQLSQYMTKWKTKHLKSVFNPKT